MVTREFFRRWGEYRQLLRELKSYSDVELADLGMVRFACARTAFDAAFGSPLEELRRWLRSPGARGRRGRTRTLKEQDRLRRDRISPHWLRSGPIKL